MKKSKSMDEGRYPTKAFPTKATIKAAFKKAGATLAVIKTDRAGGEYGDWDFYTSEPMEDVNQDMVGAKVGKALGLNFIRVTDHQGGLDWYFQNPGQQKESGTMGEGKSTWVENFAHALDEGGAVGAASFDPHTPRKRAPGQGAAPSKQQIQTRKKVHGKSGTGPSKHMREPKEEAKKDKTIDFAGYKIDNPSGTVRRKKIDLKRKGDHGADPLGNGKFKMVPSGDVVDKKERDRRLAHQNESYQPRTNYSAEQILQLQETGTA